MPQLVCFTGLPGVGKSTISRAVSSCVSAGVIDIDEFKRVHVDPLLVTNQIDPPEQRWLYYQDSIRQAFHLFSQGTAIGILDEIFHLRQLRKQMEDLCATRKVSILWVEVQCPYDLVEQRLINKSREGHILSTDEALRMNRLFSEIYESFPSTSTNHLLVRNDGTNDLCSITEVIVERIMHSPDSRRCA